MVGGVTSKAANRFMAIVESDWTLPKQHSTVLCVFAEQRLVGFGAGAATVLGRACIPCACMPCAAQADTSVATTAKRKVELSIAAVRGEVAEERRGENCRGAGEFSCC